MNIESVSGKNLIDLLSHRYLDAERISAIRAELARRATTGDPRYAQFAATTTAAAA